MSTTLINYDVVVKELSKGLVKKDDDIALCMNLLPHIALAEFRTIRYGAGRQKGVTQHAVKLAGEHSDEVLYLIHSTALRDEVIKRFEAQYPGKSNLTIVTGYLPENWQKKFNLVVIDETGFFFNKFSFDKIYRSLADVTTEDVVIHLIN